MKKSRAFAVFFQLSFTFLPFITSILLLDDQFASFLNIRLDIGDALVLHIIQHDGWAIIGLHRSEAHIIYFYAIHVAGVETEGLEFLSQIWAQGSWCLVLYIPFSPVLPCHRHDIAGGYCSARCCGVAGQAYR